MPVHRYLADAAHELIAVRRDLHRHPELGYDEHRTAGLVAEWLHRCGCDEVAVGIGKTGVVGIIRGRVQNSGSVIGIRADMDALPLKEETDLPYRSGAEGRMHACGHDGHTTMGLGAAQYLARTRNFDGTAVFVFQPAEENGAGAAAMIADGLFERYGIQEIYGLHNIPGMPVGTFALRDGPQLAAAGQFRIDITGLGGHAAKPHEAIDCIVVASHIVLALQSIVSRNVDPLESAVISVTSTKAGETYNVIPQEATLLGTVRTLAPALRDLCESRIMNLVPAVAAAFGARADVTYRRGYPVTCNHSGPVKFAAEVASSMVGQQNVNLDLIPNMGAEDFAFMLEQRPGAFVFIGNGDSAPLHNPRYDFNDQALPVGIEYWIRLIETRMPIPVNSAR